MSDIATFSVEIDKMVKAGLEQARLALVDLALETHQKCVRKTPVDTGFCRAMWGVSIGNVPPGKVMRPEKARGKAAMEARKAQAETVGKAGQMRLGDTVFIYNPTDYAMALEQGHSAQAPNGMVAVTVEELLRKYPDALRRIA